MDWIVIFFKCMIIKVWKMVTFLVSFMLLHLHPCKVGLLHVGLEKKWRMQKEIDKYRCINLWFKVCNIFTVFHYFLPFILLFFNIHCPMWNILCCQIIRDMCNELYFDFRHIRWTHIWLWLKPIIKLKSKGIRVKKHNVMDLEVNPSTN